MASETSFRFSDHEWNAIAGEIRLLGRQSYKHDMLWCHVASRMTGLILYPSLPADGTSVSDLRPALEEICNHFVDLRQKYGRSVYCPPERARRAWRNIAKAAQHLDEALKELHEVDPFSADHSGIHSDIIAPIATRLPNFLELACNESLDSVHRRRFSNNAEPTRDAFVMTLIRIWAGYGGEVAAGYDAMNQVATGPLVRFLKHVTDPAMVAVGGDDKISTDALRHIIKRATKGMASSEQN